MNKAQRLEVERELQRDVIEIRDATIAAQGQNLLILLNQIVDLEERLEGYKAAHQTAVNAQMAAIDRTARAQRMLDTVTGEKEELHRQLEKVITQQAETIIKQADMLDTANSTLVQVKLDHAQNLLELAGGVGADERENKRLLDDMTKQAGHFQSKSQKLETELAQTVDTTKRMGEIIADYRARLARVMGSWKDAPEWAKFRAYDLDGRGTWFAAKPSATEYSDGGAEGWISSFGSQHIYLKDWKNSLEEKPDFEKRVKEILGEHPDTKR